MNFLNNREKWSTIDEVAFVMTRPGLRTRQFVGLGINVIGAGVLLTDLVRWLSI